MDDASFSKEAQAIHSGPSRRPQLRLTQPNSVCQRDGGQRTPRSPPRAIPPRGAQEHNEYETAQGGEELDGAIGGTTGKGAARCCLKRVFPAPISNTNDRPPSCPLGARGIRVPVGESYCQRQGCSSSMPKNQTEQEQTAARAMEKVYKKSKWQPRRLCMN